MKQSYIYLQPEYFKNFQCDGKICGGLCCRKSWNIYIDQKTYEKYSKIKPKSKSEALTKFLRKDDATGQYIVVGRPCPHLTEGNLCSIQLEYGEDYLSEICLTYPRVNILIDNVFERSLSLTCPLVADLVLNQTEPLNFEAGEWNKNFDRIKFKGRFSSEPALKYVPNIQMAAISILQNRSLTLDERLIVLGFFLDKLDEIISAGKVSEMEKLSDFYMSENFLKTQAPLLVKNIQFDVAGYLKFMSGIFEVLYCETSDFKRQHQKFIQAVNNTFEIENYKVIPNQVLNKFVKTEDFRKAFLEKFSSVFENFLVNEFFLNAYPWAFPHSIAHNYGIFLTIYKILEMLTVASAAENIDKNNLFFENLNLTAEISFLSNCLESTPPYIEMISDYMNDKEDMLTLMQTLL